MFPGTQRLTAAATLPSGCKYSDCTQNHVRQQNNHKKQNNHKTCGS